MNTIVQMIEPRPTPKPIKGHFPFCATNLPMAIPGAKVFKISFTGSLKLRMKLLKAVLVGLISPDSSFTNKIKDCAHQKRRKVYGRPVIIEQDWSALNAPSELGKFRPDIRRAQAVPPSVKAQNKRCKSGGSGMPLAVTMSSTMEPESDDAMK